MTLSEFAGRDILITGHTGFKGSWLALWLNRLGATVHGLALEPVDGALYLTADIGSLLATDLRVDIRDLPAMRSAIADIAPDAVMHLAAQPLVRDSYLHPVETFSTNVMGTVNTVIAALATPSVTSALMVTTDKVYRNLERPVPYREDDPLGGEDPYSASKACAELATHAISRSHSRLDIRITTVRSGNVLGGGDVAPDRLLPDLIRSFSRREPAVLRYPDAVRPWQHVLDPLNGYLRIVASHLSGRAVPSVNLGPPPEELMNVRQVADIAAHAWGEGASVVVDMDTQHPHEAGLLLLDSTRALEELDWRPSIPGREAVEFTVAWYRDVEGGMAPRDAMNRDLATYNSRMRAR